MKFAALFLIFILSSCAYGQEPVYPWAAHVYYAPGFCETSGNYTYTRNAYSYETGLAFSYSLPKWRFQLGTAYSSQQVQLYNRTFQLEKVSDPNNADTTYSINNTHRYFEIPLQFLYTNINIVKSDRFDFGLGGGLSVCLPLEEQTTWNLHPLGQKRIDNVYSKRMTGGGVSYKLFLSWSAGYRIGERSLLYLQMQFGSYGLPASQKTIINELQFYSVRFGYAWRF